MSKTKRKTTGMAKKQSCPSSETMTPDSPLMQADQEYLFFGVNHYRDLAARLTERNRQVEAILDGQIDTMEYLRKTAINLESQFRESESQFKERYESIISQFENRDDLPITVAIALNMWETSHNLSLDFWQGAAETVEKIKRTPLEADLKHLVLAIQSFSTMIHNFNVGQELLDISRDWAGDPHLIADTLLRCLEVGVELDMGLIQKLWEVMGEAAPANPMTIKKALEISHDFNKSRQTMEAWAGINGISERTLRNYLQIREKLENLRHKPKS